MCTVTIAQINNQSIITMNRDEMISRKESQPRGYDFGCGIHGWYPVDSESEGTWFGVNNHGLVLSLLNLYLDYTPSARVSRGKLIPQLLACSNISSCIKVLDGLGLSQFMPFTLLLIQGTMVVSIIWNGSTIRKVEHFEAMPFLITSSSVDIDAVTEWRKHAFDNFLEENSNLNANLLLKFHYSSSKENQSYSVNMLREGRHTKSVTQISVDGASVHASYYRRVSAQHDLNEFRLNDSAHLELRH